MSNFVKWHSSVSLHLPWIFVLCLCVAVFTRSGSHNFTLFFHIFTLTLVNRTILFLVSWLIKINDMDNIRIVVGMDVSSHLVVSGPIVSLVLCLVLHSGAVYSVGHPCFKNANIILSEMHSGTVQGVDHPYQQFVIQRSVQDFYLQTAFIFLLSTALDCKP